MLLDRGARTDATMPSHVAAPRSSDVAPPAPDGAAEPAPGDPSGAVTLPVVERPGPPGTITARLRRHIVGARFPLRLRGYDPALVDDLLDRLVAELDAQEPDLGAGMSHVHHFTEGTSMSLTTITTATPAAVFDPPGIASHEFRRVRKGYDPDEVRLYLDLLARNWREVPPASQGDDARAPAVLAQAQAQADQLLRDAHREVEELKREHAAMQAWFGGAEQTSGPPAGGEPDSVVQAAVAHADDIIRSAQAQADAMIATAAAEAEARRSAGADGGLGGLGAHVERIVQQAEAEGRVLISDATAQAERLRAEAETDRAEAAATLRQAQHDADALVADARSASEAVRAAAVPAATAHVEDVLRRGRLELADVQAEIDDTRARLADIHHQLARSLGHPAPPAVLADAVVFVPPSEPHADAIWDASTSREIIVGRAEPADEPAMDPAIGELDISPW